MNVLSLFDGMSCGQIALNKADIKYDNYFASEVDKFAIKVTQSNYPKTHQLGDVQLINYQMLPKIDLLIGGSPCQGFSYAGKQLNFSDPRSILFFEFVAALRELKPKYFLLENVRMKQEYQDIISELLDVKPIRINSNLVSAQNRDRYYWTNIKGVKQPEDQKIVLEDILEGSPQGNLRQKSRTLRVGGRNSPIGSKNEWDSIYCDLRGRGNNPGGKRALDGKTPTVTANSWEYNCSVVVNDVNRRFTPIECERLQTVPDNYTNHASNTQRFKMLGNGWTIDVIAHILGNLFDKASTDN